MCISLRKDDDVPGAEVHRRLITEFHKAFAFGDQMEDHHALRTRLEKRRNRSGMRRMLAPGRGKLRPDENGADEPHHAENL
jgi:hypothetical protein